MLGGLFKKVEILSIMNNKKSNKMFMGFNIFMGI